MRLNLALLQEQQKQSVGSVGGVGSSVDEGKTSHTYSALGVGGVGNCPASPESPHLPTPPKRDMLDESTSVYAVPTPSTLPTPQKQPSHSQEAAPAPWPVPGLPSQEFDGWTDDFSLWALLHCVFRDTCRGGVALLGRHFSAWCAERGEAGPWPATFAALLEDQGFTLTERGRVQMVYGLLLHEDWEAAHVGPP